jgi:DNA-binding transcriptional MerR regulator
MYTIGQLCVKAELSRGALLYYDVIGLLKPSARTKANYRRYSEQDLERLHQICLYRETGMPLADIRQLLESTKSVTDPILEKHLKDLNQSIRKLEIQRQIIARMIICKRIPEHVPVSTKDVFVKVMHKAGVSDAYLARLHMEFERSFPIEHQAFLEFLGIPPVEITQIKEHCL